MRTDHTAPAIAVFRSGLRLIVIGIVVGLLASAAATRSSPGPLRPWRPVMLLAGGRVLYAGQACDTSGPLVALRDE